MDSILNDTILKLFYAFPKSTITSCGEFIAHVPTNQYFILKSCSNELEVKCKVIEQFSRGASKTMPYSSDRENKRFNEYMRKGINKFLDTQFSSDDLLNIYIFLGNGRNRQLCIDFIKSGYNMELLGSEE